MCRFSGIHLNRFVVLQSKHPAINVQIIHLNFLRKLWHLKRTNVQTKVRRRNVTWFGVAPDITGNARCIMNYRRFFDHWDKPEETLPHITT